MKCLFAFGLLVAAWSSALAQDGSGVEFVCVATNAYEHRFEGRDKNLSQARDKALAQCKGEGQPCTIRSCNPVR